MGMGMLGYYIEKEMERDGRGGDILEVHGFIYGIF